MNLRCPEKTTTRPIAGLGSTAIRYFRSKERKGKAVERQSLAAVRYFAFGRDTELQFHLPTASSHTITLLRLDPSDARSFGIRAGILLSIIATAFWH